MFGDFGVPVSEEHDGDTFAPWDYSAFESESEREEREAAQANQPLGTEYLHYLKGSI